MKIAVLGGSFNPLHNGHAMLAETVIKELHYDRVLFVPTFIPPHKIVETASEVKPEQRLQMIQDFCDSEKNGYFIAEDCEIKREGVSYTCDTLQYIQEKYKNQLEGKLAFILGDEIASEFSKWKNPQKIIELADLIITHRYPEASVIEENLYKNKPAGDYKGDFKVQFNIKDFKYPCIYLEKPLLPVSSTEIRKRVKGGKSYKYLVPQAVFDFIEKNNLYKSQD